ncbi:hypothetical protein D3C78_1162640 [compost metagenome]
MAHGLAEAERCVRHAGAAEQAAAALAAAERAAHRVGQAHFLDQPRRDFADEARHLVVGLAAVQAAGFRVGHDQPLHGASDADIGQTAFLLQAAGLFQAHLVREQAFLHAGEEHQRELQALGAVQGHQLDAVLEGIGLRIARLQRGMVEESHERRRVVVLAVLEGARGADQFFQVFHPGLAFLALFFLVVGDQPGLLDDGLGHQVQRHPLHLLRQQVDGFQETLQGAGGAAGHGLGGDHVVDRAPHRGAVQACGVADRLDGLLADAARRHVDHPLQRRVVVA